MSYIYTTYVSALCDLMAVPSTDPNFVTILPSIIDYAEQRIYRELDLLSTVVRDSSATLTANSRNFTLPQGQGRFVVTNGINVYTPVGTTTTRNPLVPISRDFIDLICPTDTATGVGVIPTYYAMVTDQIVVVGPAPGSSFIAEVIGTIRPNPLTSTNSTTYLTLYLPDLFLAASMIFASGYQKNFGAQSDNPQMAQSWNAQYEKLAASANIEELRKRWASVSWTSQSPSPLANPPRN